MSKVFFTSDTHFFHTKILEYCNRPYQDMDEMNQALIDNWNKVVSSDDIVYHLGDVAMGGKSKAESVSKILSSLNGTIYLIKGNHESYVLKDPCRERFEWVRDYYELRYENKLIIMQHFPLLTWNMAGKVDAEGRPLAFSLHGHCHSSIDALNSATTRLDVGVDSHNYTPISLDDIISIMNQRQYQSIDHHGRNTSY